VSSDGVAGDFMHDVLRQNGARCALPDGHEGPCTLRGQNPPMPKTNEPKRPPGRPEVPPEDRLQVVSIRLTEAQKQKLERLGGSAWVRERINRAKAKTQQSDER